MLKPEESSLTNNPNHPCIRCVDGVSGGDDGPWMHADDPSVVAPYRVFDVLNQEHVGPEFQTRAEADAHMASLGGSHVVNPMTAALRQCIDALRNVPEVGGTYDQQHSDTHLAAILAAQDALNA